MGDHTEPNGQDPEIEELHLSDTDDETLGLDDAVQNAQLIHLVRTAPGAELFVNSVAEELLKVGQSNWGRLLGAAPDALGRLGQCFVIASDPMASSLVFPDSAGLQYKSLKANLVHCSDLGRGAFREAEARMKKVSLVAQAVCEPGGTIDMVIEAVDDEDLAELDLPDQLAALKRVSKDCIDDTRAIKEKFDAWSQFANSVYIACVDKEEDLGHDQNDLDDQVKGKKLVVRMKKTHVDDTKAQTAEYRSQLKSRQDEFVGARKSHSSGTWTDLGVKAGEAIVDTAMGMLNPFSGFSFSLGWGKESKTHQEHYVPDPHDPIGQQDAGYVLADRLLNVVHGFAELLTLGPERLNGVDWDRLTGRSDNYGGISYISQAMSSTVAQFHKERSGVTTQVRRAIVPADLVATEIRKIIRDERNIREKTEQLVADCAGNWRSQVQGVETALVDITASGLELAKQKATEKQERREARSRTTKMSRAELRFERFRIAQQSLFDAETRLNQRLEEELKATEEFNRMDLQLQELLSSQVTMAKVKEIVGECVMHLQDFCKRLDDLNKFFTDMQYYIEDIDKNRIDPFAQGAKTTLELGRRAKAQTDEKKRLKQEAANKRKLEQLRIRALELKGHYLVAQAMANTYTEVSTRHIIPGVEKIDRLSLPGAKSMTKEERAQKIVEVGELAKRARRDVKLLANTRKDQFVMAMSEHRGEIREAVQIQN
ncbi:hypothetical protein EDB81DRAFT_872900 [Dactylonectria macrodidyma]|uniref:Uncharacterized protein n=1 Tax=Dactylonectria macrodidyma TaxID=307937 RepID=A0A9P9DJ64_9HYPO|nr:hypothetical protein EDB81DRAFT_872900 [Dactylonectria macrodidyma]